MSLQGELVMAQVKLDWTLTPTTPPSDTVLVNKKINDQPYVLGYAGLPGGTTTFTDTQAVPGDVHSYTVQDHNSDGISPVSNEVTVTIPALNPPPAPTNLVASLI